MYKAGDIVWANFPFDDLSQSKHRPVLIIYGQLINSTQDVLVMQITSVIRNDGLSQEILSQDFLLRPLSKQSFLRLHKIFFKPKLYFKKRNFDYTYLFAKSGATASSTFRLICQ